MNPCGNKPTWKNFFKKSSKKMDPRPIDTIADQLQKSHTVLLATHVFPDGDALGSQIALGNILKSLGKKVVLYGEEAVSHLYDFMPGSDQVDLTKPEPGQFDCAVALDCGDAERLGPEMKRILTIHPLIVIDHHKGNDGFGDINWVDPSRASTGEMIFDLARAMNAEISYETAYCLYAAIVTDTGSFKYSSTTAETFRVVRELVGKGVKPAEVAGNLFDNFTVNRLRLLQEVLATLEIFMDGKVAVIHVTQDMYDRTGTTQTDTENFVNYPRSLISVKVAVFIKANSKGGLSVSMRSKGNDCDVTRVAHRFGGGGHRNAAGCRFPDQSIQQVRDMLVQEIQPLIDSTCVEQV
jgi:phosphoesterase RecJ-like protein